MGRAGLTGIASLGGTVWRPEEVTATWLDSVLHEAGVLVEASVRGFEVEPVGSGQMGDSFRFSLRLEPASVPGPRTVVGKFTAADEQSRSTGVSMRTAEVEVRFYQQVAATLGATTPRCFFADVDPSTARFVLLLEDMAPRSQGDQVSGCAVDEAAIALGELAKVHAARWNDGRLERLEWLNRRDDAAVAALSMILPALWAGFVERYDGRLSGQVLGVGEEFFPRIGDYLKDGEGPRTVQHADYRVDNLLFGGPPEAPVAIVDWQTVTWGPAASDVAYFMGGSLETEVRRSHERELVEHYPGSLRALGVHDYTFEELWSGYRRHAFAGLVMAVGAAMTVARTDRGDEMFLAMAHRHAAHIEDVSADALLGD